MEIINEIIYNNILIDASWQYSRYHSRRINKTYTTIGDHNGQRTIISHIIRTTDNVLTDDDHVVILTNKIYKNNKGGRTQIDRLFLFNSFLYLSY